MRKLLTILFLVGWSAAAAPTLQEVQRFAVSQSTISTTFTLTNSVPAGHTLVILGGFEAPSGINLSGIADNKGNSYVPLAGPILISSVHRAYEYGSTLTSALAPGDTIVVTFSSATTMQRTMVLVDCTGVTTSVNVAVTNTGNAIAVTAPVTTTMANVLLVGITMTDQLNCVDSGGTSYNSGGSPLTYTNSNWNPLNPNLTFASPTTTGLHYGYFWTNAVATGSYNPGGKYQCSGGDYSKSWLVLEVGLAPTQSPNVITIGGNVTIGKGVSFQ